MNSRFLAVILLSALSAVGFSASLYSQTEVVEILTDFGFENVRDYKSRSVAYTCDGKYVSINLASDGAISASFNQNGYEVALGDLNQWNRNVRYTRAYFNEGNYVVKSDIPAYLNVSEEQLVAFAEYFCKVTKSFRQYLKQHEIKP